MRKSMSDSIRCQGNADNSVIYFFFFSSRRRHTRCSRDWSSDVCSSDLRAGSRQVRANRDGRKIHLRKRRDGQEAESDDAGKQNGDGDQRRSYRPSDKGRREIGRDMQVFHLISGRRLLNGIADVKLEAAAKPVKSEVDDRGGIEGQQLAENQAANDGDAEWTAQLGTDAGSERKRQTAEQRGHRGHHDGPETQQAGFVNGVERRLAFLAFSFEREVNQIGRASCRE